MARTYRIAILPGDGTGPEVIAEGRKALQAAARRFGFALETHDFDFGGERYKRTGECLPDSAIAELRGFEAIYLGAIGHPEVKPGILEKGILLRLRFELDQYINLRPVKLFPGVETPIKGKGPAEINFTVVRENTEGLYAGAGGFLRRETPQEIALQTSVNTRHGVDRCLRYAFAYAERLHEREPWRGLRPEEIEAGLRSQLTLVGKTNVLTFASDLWERRFHALGAEHPTVKRDYAHVDAACMWFVKNPEWFDVIVTDNMFGDIITDLGAMIQGGMGIAAGGNLNPEPGGVSMFEPIGGSAPRYAGQGVINPLAAICAGAMMLETLGERAAAEAIERAVAGVTAAKLKSLAAGRMGFSTSQVGDLVAEGVA